MTVAPSLDCANVFDQFGNEGKFADASKNFIESRSNYFKLTKHTVEYGFAIAEVSSIIPTKFIPMFQAIRSIVAIVFESISIYKRAIKIQTSQNNLALCKSKVKKWDEYKTYGENEPVDIERLNILRDHYLDKIRQFDEEPEKGKRDNFRRESWKEYIRLINEAIDGNDESALGTLREKFSKRKERKVENWQKKQHALEMNIKKSYFGIAVSVGAIALEIITIVGIALIPVDAGITFMAIKIGSNLIVSGMKYGKYLWWNINKGEKPGIIAIKSIEHIGSALVKSKPLPFPAVIHPSLIKGACKTAVTSICVFRSRYNFLDNNNAIAECKRHLELLRRKNVVLMQRAEKISSGDRNEMLKVISKYEDKRSGALQLISQYNQRLEELSREEDEKDRDEVLSLIGIMNADVKKWTNYIDTVNHALLTNNLADAKIAADCITERNIKHISNWKLSEQLLKKNNLKEGMKTAVSIVEIARFAFLVTAVSLALVGIGVNLLPYLFVSSLFANALYMTYAWFTLKTNKEIDGIIDLWSRDDIASSLV